MKGAPNQSDLPPHIHAAIDGYIPHMNGWTTVERGQEIAACILETKAKVCVDLGVYAGRSTIAMGFAARELGDSMVYGVDPWQAGYATEGDEVESNANWWKNNAQLEAIHRLTMEQIWAHRIERWVTIIRAPSQYVHQLFPVIDFINIDACHTEIASCRDVELYVPKLRKSGYLTFDDTDWDTTQKALRMIEETCDLVNDTGKARTYRKR